MFQAQEEFGLPISSISSAYASNGFDLLKFMKSVLIFADTIYKFEQNIEETAGQRKTLSEILKFLRCQIGS